MMQGPTTIILVRHAEPLVGDNPGLTSMGNERAKLLAFMLQNAGVTSIFISELRRTKETAAPLAAKTGLTPVVLAGVDSIAHRDRVLAAPTGVAVVVGHTNTVPSLISALGAGVVQIGATEFDRMFIVSQSAAGMAKALSLRYRV